jgi:hypothetical protein
VIGISLALGGPLVGLIVAVVALAAVVWFVAATVSRGRPSELVRETESPELLGPGGPDDPR